MEEYVVKGFWKIWNTDLESARCGKDLTTVTEHRSQQVLKFCREGDIEATGGLLGDEDAVLCRL